MFPSCAVAECHQDDPVPGTGGVAESVSGGSVGLNIELEPANVAEGHLLEERPSGLHEVLRDRIGNEVEDVEILVRLNPRDGMTVVRVENEANGVPHGGPFFEHAQMVVDAGTLEPADPVFSVKSFDEFRLGEEEEGVEGAFLDGDSLPGTYIDPRCIVAGLVGGDDVSIGRMTEEDRVHPPADFFFHASRNGAIRSMGTGNIVVEFFSEATSVSV